MSDVIQLSFVILMGACLVLAVSSRFGLPIEVMLLLGSLALSFLPGLPPVQLDPELVFLLFLPPILFYAAYFTSWRDFKANKRPISLLAVGLVLFTTISVAAVLKLLIPEIPWPIGFIFGAMVSPPDASAATAITRKLGVPRRLVTIIEGESLVNDATALVAFRFALAAISTGTFSLGDATLRFLWVLVAGVAAGLAIGWVTLWLLNRLTETRAQTLVSLLTAFGAYLAGESIHASGVISTVTAGLFFGRCLPLRAAPQTRVEGKVTWDFVVFVVNAFVFILIGLQMPSIFENLVGYSWKARILYAAVVSAAVILVRFAWVFPATYLPRLLFPAIQRKDPAPSWRAITVLSWTGMRGIVSLAAALSLPHALPTGEAFPYRSLLIFLTYTVILVTLIIPSLSLPWLLRTLGIHAGNENYREEVKARIAAIKSALEGFEKIAEDRNYSADQITFMRQRYQNRLQILESNISDQAFSPVSDEDRQLRLLLRNLIQWERSAVQRLRQAGEIHDEVFHTIAHELDLEELRLHTQRL